MTVFTKDKLTNYGVLKVGGKSLLQEDSGIVESQFMGLSQNGGVIVAFVTNFS
jgi:hypothetical protein